MALSATIVMVLVMICRIPSGFQGAIFYPLNQPRESHGNPPFPQKLQIREEIRRRQPAFRTLLLVQITAAQYLVQKPLTDLPGPIARTGVALEEAVARVLRAMANQVSGKPVDAVPDIRACNGKSPDTTTTSAFRFPPRLPI